jgi:hypothetical protein
MNNTKGKISSLGAVAAFLKKGTCSQTLFHVLNRAYDVPLIREEQATDPLAGGIAEHGYQCGQLWGAALAAGAESYRRLGPGPQAEAAAVVAAQKMMEGFRARYREINCLELTSLDLKKTKPIVQLFKFLLTGKVVRCFSMAAGFAPMAFAQINTALSVNHLEAPAPPVSCAALAAKKLGASDRHAVMAAGLAGGIGLSGGACGALATAIWIAGLNDPREKVDYKAAKARAEETVDRYLKGADYKFECAEIVGRKFESLADHAGYLREGGCSKIIEGLSIT